jgi:hypothetical protein
MPSVVTTSPTRRPESVTYSAPSGPKHRSFGHSSGRASTSWRTRSTTPTGSSASKPGGFDSATQRASLRSSPRPLGRPVRASSVRPLPSELRRLTEPRSTASSVTAQLVSGSSTGPSGSPRSSAKITLSPPALSVAGSRPWASPSSSAGHDCPNLFDTVAANADQLI